MRSFIALITAVLSAVIGTLAGPQRLPQRLPATTLTVPILMYHRIGRLPAVSGPFSAGLTVQPGVFDSQMTWLARHGFHAIGPAQLFDALEWGRALPPRPVLITFDDGYTDVLWHAEPILHRLHMQATVFVITDRISGRDRSFLDWPQLRALQRDGFSIGSHTVHHLDLTTLPQAQVWSELSQSRHTLLNRLGTAIDWFAYPAGREDPAVVRLVRRAGYLLAFTTQPGFVQAARHPFLLRRYEIRRGESLAGFAALLHSAP